MTIERITYKRVFPTGSMYLNEHIGVDILLNDGDDKDALLNEARVWAENQHKAAYPHLYTNSKIRIDTPHQEEPFIQINQDYEEPIPESEETKRCKTIAAACFSIKELDKWKKKLPEDIYNERLAELKTLSASNPVAQGQERD
jgi:hypothetical protein